MRTLSFWKVFTIALVLSLVVLPTTAYAAEEEAETESSEGSWWDRVKAAGSDAVDWVKDKAPAAKEKAGELRDNAKQKAGEARDDFREWNQNQEEEFWNRTNERLNGDESSATEVPEDSEASETAEPTSEPEATDEAAVDDSKTEDQDGAEDETEDEEAETDVEVTTESETEEPTNQPDDDTEQDDKSSRGWPLPVIIIVIVVAAIVAVFGFERWEKWYKDPDRP